MSDFYTHHMIQYVCVWEQRKKSDVSEIYKLFLFLRCIHGNTKYVRCEGSGKQLQLLPSSAYTAIKRNIQKQQNTERTPILQTVQSKKKNIKKASVALIMPSLKST